MSSLQIAIPWNNASYIPRNGFHPLYQALFDNDTRAAVQLNILDEPKFFEKLHEEDFIKRISGEVAQYRATLMRRWGKSEIANELIDHVSMEDYWLTSHIPGDIEFHHTSPLTAGERPFVFHCESLLPVFMPFAYQGRGFLKNANKIRDFYGSLFSGDKCLGIFSHLKITLDQISQFFKDPEIDAKLGLTRIGIAHSAQTQLSAPRAENLASPPRFLFTSSAQQNPVSFRLRGGYSALLFAIRYSREGGNGQFIFRCGRPVDAELEQFGIDLTFLSQMEARQKLLWMEGFLPESEQLSLFSWADFYLLPSVNLHSVSIMQAQVAGAVPIVTDTYGTDRFVVDGQTGLVLNGVRAIMWHDDPSIGIACDDHRRWTTQHARNLADQLLERITACLRDPGMFSELQQRTRRYAREEYSGKQFNEDFWQEVVKRSAPVSKSTFAFSHPPPPLLPYFSKHVTDIFSSTPTPRKVLTFKDMVVFHLKGVYWLNTTARDLSALSSWSPLFQARIGGLIFKEIAIAWTLNDLSKYFSSIVDVTASNSFLQLKLSVKNFLSRHQHIERFFRFVFPFFRKAVFFTEKAIGSEEVTAGSKTLTDTLARIPLFFLAIPACQIKLQKLANKNRFIAALLAGLRLAGIIVSVIFRLLVALIVGCARMLRAMRPPKQ